MPWTTPRTWTDNEVVTAAMLNTHVRDNFAFLYTPIYDQTLGTASASIDTGAIIPSTYRHLRIEASLRGNTGAAAVVNAQMRFNNDSGNNYDYERLVAFGVPHSAQETFASSSAFIGNSINAGASANYFSTHSIVVPHYTGSIWKGWNLSSACFLNTTAGNAEVVIMQGNWRSTSVVDRITIFLTGINLAAGSRLRVYGTF